MHPLLERQLRKLGLDRARPPTDPAAWGAFLERIDRVYADADTDRQLMERTIALSSAEMRGALDEALKANLALRESQRVLEASRQEAAQARLTAEAASLAKTRFVANMSHEIRTPMTAILGYAELLLDPRQSPEEQQACVQTIRRSGEHLLSVINDILDISKIEAGKMTIERIPCSPAHIVEEVASLMRPRAQAKGLGLEIGLSWPLPNRIVSDPTRLRQVLVNLVGNAIKFTQQGRVGVNVEFSDQRLSFRVSDTGVGLTPDQISQLFRPFVQADESMSRRYGGTGLGLAISKWIVENLGGSLTATGEPGRGCTFTATIVAEPAAQSAMISSPEETAPRPAPPAPRPGSLAGARILLAEDGVDNQRLIAHHLRKAGATVEIAENGRIAVDRILRPPPGAAANDLVLMDMQMPEVDGYSATSTLRASGFARPIIALTAHAMDGDRDKCLRAGCDDYATKPIDAATLLGVCAKWFERARAAA